MGRLRLHEREAVRVLWRGHFEAWRLSGLTQREYCERHGLSLKSFGNWRGQLKREDAAGRDACWGRHPRLRHMVSPMATPMATPMANEAADRVPAVVASLLATAQLNNVEPFAYLRDVLERMVEGPSASRLDELLPWNWKPARALH